MVIAIDGYEANVANRVGIGRYAFEILHNIYALKTKHFFRIYLPSAPLTDMPKETSWWKYRVVKPKRLWTFIGLPLTLYTDTPHADVVFSPTHYIPRFITSPRVIAIMDTSYLRYPEMFRVKDLHQLTRGTAYSVKHAKKILTISQFSKNAIIEAYRVPKDRVVVTYPGITMAKVKTQNSKVFEKYGIPAHYILSVGTIQPRKNYVRLIEAFSRILPKFADMKLVIVGKKGWLYEESLQAPKRFGVEDRVKFLDFVPEEDLAGLYEEAICLVLPSLYEGFGLPVLEAMAHKCPVVVSNVSSLPEIAGEAGIYVDPEDVGSIAQGLTQAINEHETQKESERVNKGLVHIKKFSWEKAARQTLEVLEEVAKTRKYL